MILITYLKKVKRRMKKVEVNLLKKNRNQKQIWKKVKKLRLVVISIK